MRKILMVAALALGLFIGQSAHVEATDEVYVGTWEGGWKAYVIGDSIDWDIQRPNYVIFYCKIKGVSPEDKVKYFDYVFTPINSSDNTKLIGASFRDSTGATGEFYIDNPGVYEVEYNAWKGIRYIYSETLKQAR